MGLAEKIHERPALLSGGQQQRVALVHHADRMTEMEDSVIRLISVRVKGPA